MFGIFQYEKAAWYLVSDGVVIFIEKTILA
jgi:hypothetical protein